MKKYRIIALFLTFMALSGWNRSIHATDLFSFGDTEKPKPEFYRNGQEISAKLIPRAKSTSVVIDFKVKAQGILDDVTGIDFETVDRPEVNVKNFKSAVFKIHVTGITPGEAAQVSIQSDFFTSSTAFYVYTPNPEKPWVDSLAENLPVNGRVRELTLSVRDGGELDSDKLMDGQVTLIGGPRDSFWGYALGTLLIRFFGIFLVLSILMIGMIVSGFIFKAFERKEPEPGSTPKDTVKPEAPFEDHPGQAGQISEEVAAAIGTALHLHLSSMRRSGQPPETASQDNAWALEGRKMMMNDRLSAFNRFVQ